MAGFDDHPTVLRKRSEVREAPPVPMNASELRLLCLDFGADDAGIVSIERSELDDQREDILRFAPWTKTLLAFVCRMNREPIRSTARSAANLEFHHTGDYVNDVVHHIVRTLEARGMRAVNPSMRFPMEMENFPEKIWVV